MELQQLKAIVETLIFVSEEPITENALLLILEPDGVTKADVSTAIAEVEAKYNNDATSGIELVSVAGGYQLRTKAAFADYIRRLNIPKASRLSQPALDTLSIIAYRQPIVRSEIEEIRGVDAGGVLKTLLERGLIKIVGKRDEAGSPLIYGTTKQFLELFELNSLNDLPTLREYAELEKERFGTANTVEKEDGAIKTFLEGIDSTPLAEKWDSEDDQILSDIDSGLKKLKRLERDMFPKPVETLIAVLNNGGNDQLPPEADPPSAGAPHSLNPDGVINAESSSSPESESDPPAEGAGERD